MVIQVYAPTSNVEEAEVEQFYEDLQDLLELAPQKDVLFIIGYWNAKVGSQKTSGLTGKFGLGIRNEAGQRLIEFCQEKCTGHSKHPLPTTQEKTTHRHHQVVNTKITGCQKTDMSFTEAKINLSTAFLLEAAERINVLAFSSL